MISLLDAIQAVLDFLGFMAESLVSAAAAVVDAAAVLAVYLPLMPSPITVLISVWFAAGVVFLLKP